MTCIDAFGNKYRIESCTKQLGSMNLIRELAGLEIVSSNSKRGKELIENYHEVLRDAQAQSTKS